MSTGFPPRVFIQEVVTRDGLQIEPCFLPTEDKVALIDALSQTGVAKIEVTSFVSPRAVPNLADAREVARAIRRWPDVTYVALVPNLRGAQEALEAGMDELNLVLSVSETHNLANMRMTTAQSLEGFRAIVAAAAGTRVSLNGSIATAFGCPFEGVQPAEKVLDLVEAYLAAGLQSVTLADTTGMANPRQVFALVSGFRARFGGVPLTLHFHNTRGMGLANALAALEAGADRFDASLGGIGGCPFAPGATGNISTEDFVHMLGQMGIETGVDLPALLALARSLPALLGHDIPGQVAKAGRSGDLHPVPAHLRAAQ
ncbi:hydroxymethylglutaryl-CoA lyase [Ancylobacter dichloromethanicus]|uniref:Hydroxymethylglutaryl-CoA lyase n=1 Tax=Ancylobacter dichloromethanicus TaxID=518825 RepID=A0A9W6N097_9HYPH|nr:hydroxymethylglutaryl-CoA lyase [Ancylobacter dichloromethanicus]MBS7553164.1 hydroxymethylglutaryl-CoA lyase [Ancylobacter dichloromethanicus]GLK72941.1 hydroxymethylglutaryl-CoA lyase [Ancylobacter dichloromethanicus]